jgi:hypothetical protein
MCDDALGKSVLYVSVILHTSYDIVHQEPS